MYLSRLFLFVVALFVSTHVFSEEIEFDGLYIKTQNGENIEVTQQSGEFIKFFFSDEPPKERIDTNFELMLRECKCIQIKADEFKGLTFQASEGDRDDITIHVVRKHNYLKGKDGYVRDKKYINDGEEIYILRNQDDSNHSPDVRRKMVSENQLYIQPREILSKGFYAGWVTKKTAWIFEII